METEKNLLPKKPKIAIFHFSAPPNISGVDLIIKDHARLFRLYNYKVEIVAGSGKPFRKDIPIKINRLINPKDPTIYKIRQQLEKGNVTKLFYKTEDKLLRYLKRYVVKSNIKVIIVHNLFTRFYNLALTSALVKLSQEMPDIKYINWVHDVTFFNQPDLHLKKSLEQIFPWNLLVTPHKGWSYVTVSDFLKKDLINSFPKNFDKQQIHVIPNTHDIQKFFGLSPAMRELYSKTDIENADLVACIPVRAIPRKRLDFAIDVAHEINKKNINFKLLMTANMDTKRTENVKYYNFLKQKINKEKLNDKVFLLEEMFNQFNIAGRKSNISIPQLFLISDFLLFTSSVESFGMPLIEAGLMRCPIFATDIEPFKEIGTTNINYFKLTDSPKKVADFILKKIKSFPQSYFYRKAVNKYSIHKTFKEVVLPLLNS